MTEAELAALRAAAEAATPGAWAVREPKHPDHVYGGGHRIAIGDGAKHAHALANAVYIAKANPAAVLALIAEVERQRHEIASLRLTLGGRTFSATVPAPIGCPMPGQCAQVAEIERLRACAEVMDLRATELQAAARAAKMPAGSTDHMCANVWRSAAHLLREAING